MARRDDSIHRYAERVAKGKLPACQLHRLACERHLTDLAGAARGFHFDERAAGHAVRFFHFLKHSKGEWAGVAFDLEEWQSFIIGSLFGWMREEDGTRRFRNAYIEIPKKNGKSTLAAGVGLYLFCADDEPGAEVYTAATKRDQARIVHGEAKRMVKASPTLNKRVTVHKDNLSIERSAAVYKPLGADADSLDGPNVHGAIIDELHAHKTRAMVDVLSDAGAARRQPMMFEITTAGYDRESICWEHHDHSAQVLSGVVEDPAWFAFLTSVDDDDDWSEELSWRKANPNYGVSVKTSDMREKATRALQIPAYQNTFRRLRLNQWTQQEERWMPVEDWDATAGIFEPEELRGRECYAGLDLATGSDIAALVLVFPPERGSEGPYHVLPFFWIPEDNMRERVQRDRVPYDLWARNGHLEATAGNVIDYKAILRRIVELGERQHIREIAFDRWGAQQISQELQDDYGFTVVPFGQGYASMSAPTRDLMVLTKQKRIRHGGHPVLRWMADNMVVRQDPAGNLKPDKGKSREKIDGMVALIMGLARALVHQEAVEWKSA